VYGDDMMISSEDEKEILEIMKVIDMGVFVHFLKAKITRTRETILISQMMQYYQEVLQTFDFLVRGKTTVLCLQKSRVKRIHTQLDK
jgi:hypothetical protein